MDSPTPTTPPDTDRALGDVLLVAAVYLLPATYTAFESWFVAGTPMSLLGSEMNLTMRAIGYSALGLFVVFRSGEPPAAFGLTRPRVSDLFFGLLLWLGVFMVMYVVGGMIPDNLFGLPSRLGFSSPPPRTPLDYTAVVVASCLNGFGEEVVMRSVLQTRLEKLMRSAASAIVVTAVLFALYHAYYGLAGAIQCGLFGLAMGVVFRLGKCLWPVAVAHAMQDFVPMVWYADVTQ